MRTLNVVLEDKDYLLLEKAKNKKTWREFLADVGKQYQKK